MADSFFSRLKGKVQSAGKEAQRLAQIGQLKLDLGGAKSELDRAYRSLGRACANRLIDRAEAELSVEDPGLAVGVSEVRAARDKVSRIEASIAALQKEETTPAAAAGEGEGEEGAAHEDAAGS